VLWISVQTMILEFRHYFKFESNDKSLYRDSERRL